MARPRAVAVAVAVVLLAAWIAVAALGGQPSTSAPDGTTDAASGLPIIARDALPSEARTTLGLIAAGGPFPYRADGSVYENRERLLPIRPVGTYREYTVVTPGSADRGARRIVTGRAGEAWWTADHYSSFARIVP